MTEQAMELRRAYKREWNRRNRERVKQHQSNYWERKARQAAELAEAKEGNKEDDQ